MGTKFQEIRNVRFGPVEMGDTPKYPALSRRTGLILNGGSWEGKFSFSFLDFSEKQEDPKNVKSKYYQLSPKIQVRRLSPLEVKNKLGKAGAQVIHYVPLRGCMLGTDPEMFLVDKKDVVIPAFNFLPAKDSGNPFWDGFQAEFTVEAGTCMAYMTDRVRAQLVALINRAKRKYPDARLSYKSVIDIPQSIMSKATPSQRDLGCEPSMNVRRDIVPIEINAPEAIPFRFAGCHTHLGIGEKPRAEMEKIVKYMDRIFGPISVALFAGLEDKRRRQYYGKAGEFRMPQHGLEYRVPSSAMMMHPAIFHLCFEIIRCSLYLAQSEFGYLWSGKHETACKIVDTYDVEMARKVIEKNKHILEVMFEARFGIDQVPKIFELIKVGPREYFEDALNIEKNWYKGTHWATHSDNVNACVHRLGDKKKKKMEVI